MTKELKEMQLPFSTVYRVSSVLKWLLQSLEGKKNLHIRDNLAMTNLKDNISLNLHIKLYFFLALH